MLVSRWNEAGPKGRHLFALARVFRMTKILRRMLDESRVPLAVRGTGAVPLLRRSPLRFRVQRHGLSRELSAGRVG